MRTFFISANIALLILILAIMASPINAQQDCADGSQPYIVQRGDDLLTENDLALEDRWAKLLEQNPLLKDSRRLVNLQYVLFLIPDEIETVCGLADASFEVQNGGKTVKLGEVPAPQPQDMAEIATPTPPKGFREVGKQRLVVPRWVWLPVLIAVGAALMWHTTFSRRAREADNRQVHESDAERRREDEEQRRKPAPSLAPNLPLAKRTFGLKEARKFAERPGVTNEDCLSYMEKCRLRGGKITLQNDFLRAQDACDAAKALARRRLEQATARVQQTEMGSEERVAANHEVSEAQENFERQFQIAAELQRLVDRFIPPTF